MNKKFKIYHEDYLGSIPKEIEAYNKDDAARKYAQYFNTRCENVLLDDEITIFIENEKGSRSTYKVSASLSIDYHVEEQ